MQVLHLDLKAVAGNYVELRYFVDNPNQYERRSLPLTEIADLIELAERDYYVSAFPEDYAVTGRRLYNWLDGSDRNLQSLLDKYRREGVVLAIATAEKLAHLPWEVLHDGSSFLVQRVPAVVPVRWMSDSTVKKLTIRLRSGSTVEGEPANRALQVLFMATSPLDVEPVLDFEAEEARILAATARQPLALTVEESGCLSELGYLVDGYDRDYFDVLHLTGHATLQAGQPRFITETLTGEAYYASAEDIAQELQFRLPKLIFLSGCRTGQAGNGGDVPSMAEELLKSGAKAVLGWGQKVLDPEATAAAAALYQELSAGKQIAEAVASTYQALIKNQARDWHLLRLYAAGDLPSSLVTPVRTRGRKPAPPPTVTTQFLDPAGKVKVPTRESFVGRRRQLQNCLRVLTQSPDEVGVLIHGMGGLGKSSLAARLCDRLPNFERVVWVGHIDEGNLVSRLAEKLDDNEQRKNLQNYDEELRFRLRRVFQQLHEGGKSFLLVLDDFEVNLAPRNESYVLQAEAAEVLQALVWAIRENYTSHRIIITCRYDFKFTQLQYFYKQPLDALQGADLRKKFNRLTAFGDKSQVDEALKLQAQKLADGNPRLLEWLDKILQNTTVDQAAILNSLETDRRVELREQVLAEALLQQMDTTMREILSRGLVFELPVPREALAAVCENIPNLEHYINRAVALGLLEVSHDEALRVPGILPVQLAGDGEALYKQAAKVLYRLWWEEAGTEIEEQQLEIHRVALLGKEGKKSADMATMLANRWSHQSRFREAIQLCKSTLQITEDYRVFQEMAYCENVVGEIDQALKHYHQALNLCPLEDKRGQASINHHLGMLKADIGEISEAIILYEQSLALKEQIGDFQNKATTLHSLGMLKADRGEIEAALVLYQQSLALNEKIGDVEGKATTLHSLGMLKADRGEIEAAIALYEQSLALNEQIGNIKNKAATLHQLGILKANRGEIEAAIALYEQSLAISEQIGNVQGKAATLNNLGILKANRGEIEKAINLYQQSLAISEQIGDVQGKAATLHCLGRFKAHRGDIEEALALFQQSLILSEQIGNVQTKAAMLDNLGILKADRGDIEEALALFQQSLVLSEQIGNVQGQATTLHNLGVLKANRGEIEEALALFQQSLAISEQIGNVQGKAATLHCLGRFKADRGEIEEAINLYQQSLAMSEQIGNVQGKAAMLNNLGMLKADRGEIEAALALFQQSLAIDKQIGDVQGQATTLHNLGVLKANRGEIEAALALFQQSLALNEQIGDVQGKAMTLWWLGHIAEQQGNYNQALDYLQPALEILQRIQSPDAETLGQVVARVQGLIDNS